MRLSVYDLDAVWAQKCRLSPPIYEGLNSFGLVEFTVRTVMKLSAPVSDVAGPLKPCHG